MDGDRVRRNHGGVLVVKEKTVKEKILDRLREADRPLAIHEFNIMGVSESTVGARLRDLTQEGKLTRGFRKDTGFKEWSLPEWDGPAQRDLGIQYPANYPEVWK